MVYRAQVGIDLSNGKRVEAGEWIADDDVPKRAVGWLRRGGYVVHEPDEPDERSEPEPEDEEE